MTNEEENRLEQKLDKYFDLTMGEIKKMATKDEVHEIVNEKLDKYFGLMMDEIQKRPTKEEVYEIVDEAVKKSEERLEKKMDDGFLGVSNRTGGLDNRIDNEAFARKDLENRVRVVLPNLPQVVEQA